MQQIDITTTQNVTIEHELASLGSRFVSLLIDGMIVGVAYFVLLSVLSNTLDGHSVMSFSIFLYIFPIALFILYQLLSEVFGGGQSWGKKAMDLQVMRLDGDELEFSDFLLRAVFHLLDTIPFGVLGALLISSTARSQRLGDIAANTVVIKRKSAVQMKLEDILGIHSKEDYEPVYPEVKNLNEKDMLLVKHIISRNQSFQNKAHREAVDEVVNQLTEQLGLLEKPTDKIDFLKTLIRDYIVLTR